MYLNIYAMETCLWNMNLRKLSIGRGQGVTSDILHIIMLLCKWCKWHNLHHLSNDIMKFLKSLRFIEKGLNSGHCILDMWICILFQFKLYPANGTSREWMEAVWKFLHVTQSCIQNLFAMQCWKAQDLPPNHSVKRQILIS